MLLQPPKWFKYPKLLTLASTFVLAYLLLQSAQFGAVREFALGAGYFGTFIAGIMYAYGFTAAPATAILFLFGKTQNIYLAAAFAGLGALLADFVIFRIIRNSFTDELETLSREWAVTKIISLMPSNVMGYLLPVIGCIIIASPLPDEIGVTMLAFSRSISSRAFSVISFALNAGGAFTILWLGSIV